MSLQLPKNHAEMGQWYPHGIQWTHKTSGFTALALGSCSSGASSSGSQRVTVGTHTFALQFPHMESLVFQYSTVPESLFRCVSGTGGLMNSGVLSIFG